MDEERMKRDSERETRRQVMLDVEEGMKSSYWKILEKQIKVWIAHEKKMIEFYDSSQIDPDMDRKALWERNRSVERKNSLERILMINSIILQSNKNQIDRLIESVKEKFQYVKTFVGRK